MSIAGPLRANENSLKPFACATCGYRATRKGDIVRHLRMHSGEKPFGCTYCSYRTTKKCHLTTHIRVHTGEKPFACDQCNYRASDKSTLSKHLRVHTGDKPFACSICSFRTTHKSHLTAHVRTHDGENPFMCGDCNYSAQDKSDIMAHMLTHGGDPVVECEHCSYRTTKASNMVKHLEIHNGDKLVVCEHCSFRTYDDEDMAKHIHAVHEGRTGSVSSESDVVSVSSRESAARHEMPPPKIPRVTVAASVSVIMQPQYCHVKAAAETVPSKSTSKSLPTWVMVYDPRIGKSYHFNTVTAATRWDPPPLDDGFNSDMPLREDESRLIATWRLEGIKGMALCPP